MLKVLARVAYAGKAKHKDEVPAGEREVIVDGEVWRRARLRPRMTDLIGTAAVRSNVKALLQQMLERTPQIHPMEGACKFMSGGRTSGYFASRMNHFPTISD